MNAKRHRPSSSAASPPSVDPPFKPWFCIEEMEPIWQINLELLRTLTAYNGDSRTALLSGLPPDVIAGLHGLGKRGRERLARIPCLLVDGGFQQAERWTHAKQGLDDGLITGVDRSSADPAVDNALARSTMHLAWHWTRAHKVAAPLILNASPACTIVISLFDPMILNHLADNCCAWFRPRWEHQPQVWRSLSALAHEHPASALFSADPKGLDILFSELKEELSRKQ